MDRCDDETWYVGDLAEAVDISPRTLQTVFVDYYGISPLCYFTLRKLRQVRAALRNADADVTTITGVAARFGFWQFGRFAGQYRSLFGELPGFWR